MHTDSLVMISLVDIIFRRSVRVYIFKLSDPYIEKRLDTFMKLKDMKQIKISCYEHVYWKG